MNTTTSKLKNIGSSSTRDTRKCSFLNGLSCGVYIHIQTSSQLCCKILQISCNKKNHKITVIQHANWHDPNIRKKSARLPFYSTVHVNNLCPRYLIQKVKILCSSYLSCQKVAFNLFITPIPNYEEKILSQKLLKLWMKCYGTTIQMKLFWLIFGMGPFIS